MESLGPQHDRAAAQWLRWTTLIWAVACFALIAWKWQAIRWFALGDTDDNMRIVQVRAWLGGQDWFDLRQHKLDPLLGGANIHWSRLVDLPIAALELVIRPLFGGAAAERWAAALAPLLPLGVALCGVALTARRLIAPAAFALAALLLFCGQNAMLMWMPLRVDHHGWQLALLSLAVAGAVDPHARRGGITLGLASAASIAIGLEMLLYLGALGGVAALRWTGSREAEAPRLSAYGLALAGGCLVGYLGFASWDNRLPVCEALSPVWLSVALVGGGLLLGLSRLRFDDWRARLAAAAVAGGVLAGFYAVSWPHCLGRLEGVSPELYDLWLKNVREAKPVYAQGWRVWAPTVALPLSGLLGYGLMLWRTRAAPAFGAWASAAVPALLAAGLLLWQTRAAPASQLLAAPGAAALGWLALRPLMRHANEGVRLAGTVFGFLLVSGIAAPLAIQSIPEPQPGKARQAIAAANRRCPTLPALRPIARLPAATVLTMVDLGPRLIAVTHHRAIAGPYHRNQAAILDVHHAFRSVDPAVAHGVMRRHGATLLLLCPGLSETTIYASQNPRGFYAQLRDGKAPAWLAPVALPKDSPFRLWRLADRQGAATRGTAARPAPPPSAAPR